MNSFHKRIFLVFAAATLASPVSKAEPAPVTCPAPAEVSKRVLMCGMNNTASVLAQQCAKKLIEESRVRGQAVQAIMDMMKKSIGQAQSANMDDARKRLALGITSLSAEIENLKSNTDKLADYAGAMINIPGAKNEESSLDCFTSAFKDLQKTVTALDTEILSAQKARLTAALMASSLKGREGNMDSLSRPALSAVPAAAPAPQGPRKGSHRLDDSKVTGIEEDLKKQQLPKR